MLFRHKTSTAKARRGDDGRSVVATNRRARHDFEILDEWECGIVLVGSESLINLPIRSADNA